MLETLELLWHLSIRTVFTERDLFSLGLNMDGLYSCFLSEAAIERQSVEQRSLLERYLDTAARPKNLALYNEYAEDALQSSGAWLLAEPKFQDWMRQKSSLLWIAGGPGTGKSYLSAITVSKLNDVYPQDLAQSSPVVVGYFYVKGNDQDLQNLTNLLKTIAYQIASFDAVFQANVVTILSRPEVLISPRKIWENLFLNFYRGSRGNHKAAMIVIDGLDEAPRKTIKELFHLLQTLVDPFQDPPRLSFALFGRPELTEYVEPKMQKILSIIEIGEQNLVDIGLYVKVHVKEVLVVRQMLWSKSILAARKLAREIRDRVMAKADGMFFKVVLIMNQLYDKERTSYVFNAIEDAPPQLEEMIGHVFERLLLNEDVNKEDLKEILTWVAFSKRPLLIAELYAILKIRTGQAYDALEARLRGRFASLFKLHRCYDLDDDDFANEKTLKAVDDFETDLFSDEFENEDDTSSGIREENQLGSDQDDSMQMDVLNQHTIKRFYSLEIRFTHASIRDFLVKDRSKAQASLFNLNIKIDPYTAEMHLASMCMQSILDYRIDYATGDCDILSYAAIFFADHLLSINTSKIGIEAKQHLIRQICGLFFDPTGVQKLITASYRDYNRTLHTWFDSSIFSIAVRKDWLKNAVQDQHTKEEWEWISKAVISQKEFFQPLAFGASQLWLSKKGHDDPAYSDNRSQLYAAWIVHCFLKLVSTLWLMATVTAPSTENVSSRVANAEVGCT
jgi:hypothetical protein